jgi:hypothetical protein
MLGHCVTDAARPMTWSEPKVSGGDSPLAEGVWPATTTPEVTIVAIDTRHDNLFASANSIV